MLHPPFKLEHSWSPLTAEYVLADLLAWQEAGLKTALVTLVHIDGATPRPLGAQMAVAEDGRFTGYLSGGCIEQAVALEAQRAIASATNLLVRYGKGSRYVDIKLPCGSGLDLYIDCMIDMAILREAVSLQERRVPFELEVGLETGARRIIAPVAMPRTQIEGEIFRRGYMPDLRMFLLGNGPAVAAIAHLGSAAGLSIAVATSGERTRREVVAAGLSCLSIEDFVALSPSVVDGWSAAVLAFHEHDVEAPLLERLLATECFYLGALGGRAAQAQRSADLKSRGISDAGIQRVRGPIGLISGAKSRGLLAVGIIAEILAEAKAQGRIV